MKGLFFNAQPTTDIVAHPSGYDREYDSDDFNRYMGVFFTDGIYVRDNGDACKVTASGLALTVTPGIALLDGGQCHFEAWDGVTISQGDGLYSIMCRRNNAAEVRAFELVAVKGEGAYPAPVREGDLYDLCLAHVQVAGGVATMTDTREDRELCGFAALTGQPPYYPPDEANLPYILWLYILGLPMTPEQVAAVEGNPSLMEIYSQSRIVQVAQTATKAEEEVRKATKLELLAEYSTAGSYTLAVGADIAILYVVLLGGGGGGAGGQLGFNNGSGGNGGNGGYRLFAGPIDAQALLNKNIVVGQGGAGGNGGNSSNRPGWPGQRGGSTSAFGLIAAGGEGGNIGLVANATIGLNNGGLGGTGGGNGGSPAPQAGSPGTIFDSIKMTTMGAGGGGGAGTTGYGQPVPSGAIGGTSNLGAGGNGGKGSLAGGSITDNTPGTNGTYGSGGGGGGCGTNQDAGGTGSKGGAGGAGYVAVYCVRKGV